MRKMLCLSLFLLFGCKAQTSSSVPPAVDLSGLHVAWSGDVNQDPELKADFDETVVCMQEPYMGGGSEIKTMLYPKIVVIAEPTFTCSSITDEVGCTDFNYQTIYVSQKDLYTYVTTHEFIHWIAQVDNSQHFKAYFNCAYQVYTFYE